MSYIYLITNTVNGKTYVGKSNGKNKYYYTGGLIIRRAIKKYGKKAFNKEKLVEGNFNESFLEALEKHYISLLSHPSLKSSYNITIGGGGISGFKHSDVTKDIIRAHSKINSNRPSHKKKIGNIKHWEGKQRSKSTLKAIRTGVCKPVAQYTLDNIFVKNWECIQEASEFYNLKSNGIYAASDPNIGRRLPQDSIGKE